MNKIAFALFLIWLEPAFAARTGPTNHQWNTLETKHFKIIHTLEQLDLGLYYARIAEEAYGNLAKVFKSFPERTTIVISDNTDASNGNATVFPYPVIFVYPVLVGNQDNLSEAGEWAKELLTHELTHIAQLYPYSSGYEWLRPIFGSVVSPNLLTPNWWKEGMAVEMETQFSPQGRTRSYLQDAQTRAYVEAERFERFTLAEANESLITWPYGNRQYFLGSLIMSQLAHEGKLSAIGKMVAGQSSQLPFNINSSVQDVLDSDYANLFYRTIDFYQRNAEAQISTLKQVPVPKLTPIHADLLLSRGAQYHPKFKILGFLATDEINTKIRFYTQEPTEKKPNTEWKEIPLARLPKNGVGSFAFHPSEKKIVYGKTHNVNYHQNFSDLFLYDLDTQKNKQITFSERARDPVFSPDAEWVLYNQTKNGITELKLLDVKTLKTKSLYKTNFSSRINSYSFLNGEEILFTTRYQNGDQVLNKLALVNLEIVHLTTPKQIRAIYAQDNSLYYTSTENGVANVYRAQIKENTLVNIKPLTHLITGTQDFAIDSAAQRVFANVIGPNGSFVAETPFYNHPASLPRIQNQVARRYNYVEPEPLKVEARPDEYSALDDFYPHYWIPFISSNTTGNGLLFQAMTSGQDPLGFHSYAAQVNFDSFNQKLGYFLNYTNEMFSWPMQVSAVQAQQLFGVDTYIRKNSVSASVFPDTFKLSEDIRFSLGTSLNQTEDPFLTTNHLGGYVQAGFNDVEQKNHHYYPMSGTNGILRYQQLFDQNQQTNKRFGNYSQLITSLSSFQHLFLPKDHVIKLKLDGLYTFEEVATRFGTSNLSLPLTDDLLPQFLLRGYRAGQFLGTQLATMNFEYLFPINNLSTGSGTTPFFIKYLTGAAVVDALSVRGFGLHRDLFYEPLEMATPITSFGLEARLSTTLGYLLPINFVFGLYAPTVSKYAEDTVVTGLAVQISGF